MEFETATMQADEMNARVELNQTSYFKSNFNFLKAINGLRPGELHMILAPSGAGKSTLMRSILLDINESGSSVLLWLTEESSNQFKTAMSYSKTSLTNVSLFSEVDNGFFERNIEPIRQALNTLKPDIFILDNLTASVSYELLRPAQQTVYIIELKKMCYEMGIPFLIFGHTNMGEADLRGREIGLNDIRGGKGVAMLFEFVYTLQSFQVDAGLDAQTGVQKLKRINKLSLIKNRTQLPESINFILNFNRLERRYNRDIALGVGDMKKLWKERIV
jgi:hypothetical protein